MPGVGWRKLARLKKGENIVGRYIDRLIVLNPNPVIDPLDRLQQLFSEQDKLSDGSNPERFAVIKKEIQNLSNELSRKRKL